MVSDFQDRLVAIIFWWLPLATNMVNSNLVKAHQNCVVFVVIFRLNHKKSAQKYKKKIKKGPEHFVFKNLLVQKFWVQKMFQSTNLGKKMCGYKNFRSNKFLAPKRFESKKILTQTSRILHRLRSFPGGQAWSR